METTGGDDQKPNFIRSTLNLGHFTNKGLIDLPGIRSRLFKFKFFNLLYIKLSKYLMYKFDERHILEVSQKSYIRF